MSDVKIVLDMDGLDQLRKSDEVAQYVTELAEHMQKIAGNHFDVNTKQTKKRFRATVGAIDIQGRAKNAKHNTLLKAAYSVRRGG